MRKSGGGPGESDEQKPTHFTEILVPSISIKVDPDIDSYSLAGDDGIGDDDADNDVDENGTGAGRHISYIELQPPTKPPSKQRQHKAAPAPKHIKTIARLKAHTQLPVVEKKASSSPAPFMSSRKVKIFASFGRNGQYECGHCLDAGQISPPLKTRRQIMHHFKADHGYELKTACPLCQKCKCC